jgi:hypothetical protein
MNIKQRKAWEVLRKALLSLAKSVSSYWDNARQGMIDGRNYKTYKEQLAKVDQLLKVTKQSVRRNKLLKERKYLVQQIERIEKRYGKGGRNGKR